MWKYYIITNKKEGVLVMQHIKPINVTVNYYRYSNKELLKTFKRENTTYEHTMNSLNKMGYKHIKGNGINNIDIYLAGY